MRVIVASWVKHFRHLRYLAGRHDLSLGKVRFATSPFAFIFLITGIKKYHIILETLDTEEATYLWSVDKDIETLQNEIANVDEYINQIKQEGRDAFLNSPPVNFTRVLHDYSDDRKGFVLWKDKLEENLA